MLNYQRVLFIGDFLIETPVSRGFPIVTFDYRRVYEWKLFVNNGELMAIMGYHGISLEAMAPFRMKKW